MTNEEIEKFLVENLELKEWKRRQKLCNEENTERILAQQTEIEKYKIAFELLLDDVYNCRLRADTISCSSCPYLDELFGICQNQGLYEDCKTRWREHFITQAEKELKEDKQ